MDNRSARVPPGKYSLYFNSPALTKRQLESDNGPVMKTQDFEGPFNTSGDPYQLQLPSIESRRDSIQSQAEIQYGLRSNRG